MMYVLIDEIICFSYVDFVPNFWRRLSSLPLISSLSITITVSSKLKKKKQQYKQSSYNNLSINNNIIDIFINNIILYC